MDGLEKVVKYLSENRTFYYASVDNGKARVRPFGFFMVFEGKLYFGMGKHKESFKQTAANPYIEVCTCGADHSWIRIRGRAIVDERPEALEKAFEVSPGLKNIYNEKSGLSLGLCFMEDGYCEIAGMGGDFDKFTF